MKIKLIENEKPNLKVCEMKCDNGLSEHLNKYPLTTFLNQHSVNLLIGKPRSGKTSLCYSLFKSGGKDRLLKKVYHNIYLFQPTHSRGSMKDNIFDEKLKEENKFDELTLENLQSVMSRIKNAEPYENHCILFDDMGSYLRNKEVALLFKEAVYNRRHLHLSIFFLVQSWLSVAKDLRKLFTNIFLFKVSKSEMENLFAEVIETKKDLMLDVMKFTYDKPYQWLFINTDTGRMFKMFDEIIIEED